MHFMIIENNGKESTIKDSILASVRHVDIDVYSLEEGEKQFDNIPYDLVICGEKDYSSKFIEKVRSKKDSSIIVTTMDPELMQHLEKTPNAYGIFYPFNPLELIEVIKEIYFPTTKRNQTGRVRVPLSRAVFHWDDQEVVAEILDFSTSGMMCEFVLMPRKLWSAPGAVSLQLPPPYSSLGVEGIKYAFTRLSEMNWGFNTTWTNTKIACSFVDLTPEQETALNELVETIYAEMASE